MVWRAALVAGVTTAGLGLAAIGHVAGRELRPRAAPSVVQTSAVPSAPAPVVASFGKKTFKVQPEPQTLTVSGANFSAGSTASLEAPFGLVTTFVSASLVDVTPTSFKLTVTLDEPGTYLLRIRAGDGQHSNSVPVVVTR